MPRTLAGAEPQLLASTDIRSLDVGCLETPASGPPLRKSDFPWQSTALANFTCASDWRYRARRRRRIPTRRIIARTTFTMAAVYENLSSDLVWQIARTLPTTEIIHNPGGIGDWRYWSRDGMMEGKCCTVSLCCTVLQAGIRRAGRENIAGTHAYWNIEGPVS